jgi:hypothetical protein
MKIKSLRLIAAAVMMTPVLAGATVIFFDDFETASAAAPLGGGVDFNSTEREGGQYLSGVFLPGWSIANPGQLFLHVGDSGNTSVLLNEGGTTGISRSVAGLLPGVAHVLTFEYWGDNTPSASYSFEFEINGAINAVSDVNSGLRTGNFHTVSFAFTPLAAFSTLRFTETAGGSPLFDNLTISTSAPEPGTLALLSFGLAGLGFVRRDSSGVRAASRLNNPTAHPPIWPARSSGAESSRS